MMKLRMNMNFKVIHLKQFEVCFKELNTIKKEVF